MVVEYLPVTSDTQVQTSTPPYSSVLTSLSLSFLRTRSQGLANRAVVMAPGDSARKAWSSRWGVTVTIAGADTLYPMAIWKPLKVVVLL